jgi:hypothetical protein
MHISINTAEEISDLDRQVLGLLAGGSFILGGEPQEFVGESDGRAIHAVPDPEPEPAKRTAPAKRTTAAKKPEPTPEPMAEEPVEEESEDDVLGEEETSDEDLLALAVKKATDMVAAGEAPKVREALDAAGAGRVRELNAGNVRAFFEALP